MNLPEIDDELPDKGLFSGDMGELPLDTRRVLVQLLQGPSIDEQRHPKLWPVLLRDEEIVTKRLADLFLKLVIDRDLKVAFTRQADTGDLEVPSLLRRSQLTFIDSVLLLYLRQRLTQAESHGERAAVSKEEITEYLIPYKKAGNTDEAGFNKRIFASIEKAKKHYILQKIKGSENRFEVSPTLKILFSPEEIQKLTALYKNMASGEIKTEDNQYSQEDEDEEL
jgi:hypothetical protein